MHAHLLKAQACRKHRLRQNQFEYLDDSNVNIFQADKISIKSKACLHCMRVIT